MEQDTEVDIEWMEFYHNIDIAVVMEVVAEDGTEQAELDDLPAIAKCFNGIEVDFTVFKFHHNSRFLRFHLDILMYIAIAS